MIFELKSQGNGRWKIFFSDKAFLDSVLNLRKAYAKEDD